MRQFLLIFLVLSATAAAQERRNWFNDPFAQATGGLPACPVPEGPLLTEAEQRTQAHYRNERGTSCWLAKKCDTPNAYADDAQINAAVVRAVGADPRLAQSSVWVLTQRRFVYLQGCVRSPAQRQQLLALARAVPKVEYTIDELLIGTRGAPPYRVRGAHP